MFRIKIGKAKITRQKPFWQMAEENPRRALSIFLSVIEKNDHENCALDLDSVRKAFNGAGRNGQLRRYTALWLNLLLEALNKPEYQNSYLHNRSLFHIAMYLNDRNLAGRVSDVYLRGFDLEKAFFKISRPSGDLCEMTLNKDVKIRNKIYGKTRVLIHVDGDMAFHKSEVSGLSCAETMLQFLSGYGYPATVSFVCEEVIQHQIENKGNLFEQGILLRLKEPNIAVASHGFIHPYSWQKEDFDLTREMLGSKQFLENWAGMKISLFLYTGDCLLSSRQLREVERCGMLGINGQAHFKSPIIKYVDDWFQFLDAGINEYCVKDYSSYMINKFDMIVKGLLDYPISIYVHHYSMLTETRILELKKIFEWLDANSRYLYFDTLENYYGELRKQLLRLE